MSRALLGCGAPQLLIRLVLPPPPPPATPLRPTGASAIATPPPRAAAPPLRVDGCWDWLLAVCCRAHHVEVLAFAAAVPAFRSAVRESAHLATRPAQHAMWPVLLAAHALASTAPPAKAATAKATAKAGVRVSAEAIAEANVGVAAVLAPGGGCAALRHALDLLAHFTLATAVLRPLLTDATLGKELLGELEAFRVRTRAAAAADGTPKAVAAAAGEAVDGGRGPADGAEKEAELLGRAAVSLKALMQGLHAPGKGD